MTVRFGGAYTPIMEHEFPLAYLAQMVARALSQESPTRLAVRNSDRFGLVHLYFAHGRLTGVAGHRASPLALLADLATWRDGAIRRDEGPAFAWPDTNESSIDPTLAPALTRAIRALEATGVISPSAATVPASLPLAGTSGPLSLAHPSPTRMVSSSLPPYPHTSNPLSLPPTAQEFAQLEQVAGLPPLAHAMLPPEPPTSLRHASLSRGESLSGPQWQMIALIIHQVVERAAEQIGKQFAENLLRQSLGHVATIKEPLRLVEMEDGGWLRIMPASGKEAISQYSTSQVADAIAALLTTFEMRCASLVGQAQAQHIITTATAPFRSSLAQLGLAVADSTVPGDR